VVDFIPVLLVRFGAVSVLKPEWVATLHRRQKAAGTTRRPEDIETTETWIEVTRLSGLAFIGFGVLLTIQSL
jgi:hypothetical protein